MRYQMTITGNFITMNKNMFQDWNRLLDELLFDTFDVLDACNYRYSKEQFNKIARKSHGFYVIETKQFNSFLDTLEYHIKVQTNESIYTEKDYTKIFWDKKANLLTSLLSVTPIRL